MTDLPDHIDPEAMYRVDLARAVGAIGGVRLPARGLLTLRGDLLARLIEQEGADVVRSAVAE